MERKQLEVACFDAESAIVALSCGAHRIELCRDRDADGLTPTTEVYQQIRDAGAPEARINVMIRAHGRNFVYSEEDKEEMIASIEMFRDLKANGFVFGCLNAENKIDEETCKNLLKVAHGLPCTFHRAFDAIPKQLMADSLEVLIKLGFKSVLTSGGSLSAPAGRTEIEELVKVARGRIDIIVGGGVRSSNIKHLKLTGALWYHSSGFVRRILTGSEDTPEFNGEEIQELLTEMD